MHRNLTAKSKKMINNRKITPPKKSICPIHCIFTLQYVTAFAMFSALSFMVWFAMSHVQLAHDQRALQPKLRDDAYPGSHSDSLVAKQDAMQTIMLTISPLLLKQLLTHISSVALLRHAPRDVGVAARILRIGDDLRILMITYSGAASVLMMMQVIRFAMR